MAYKQDQGRMVRMAAYWSLAVLLFYGCHSLYYALIGQFPQLGDAFGNDLKIPVVGIPLNASLLISGLVLAAGLFLLFRWQNTPQNAELLIETESELRKVTWPTMTEAVGSSVVVIVTVAILMAFLAGSDWVLARWATYLLAGR
jgi:preprotein translocase SecE subunit